MAADFMVRRALFLNSLLIGAVLISCRHPTCVINSMDPAMSNRNGIIFFNQSPFTGTLFSLFPGSADTAVVQHYRNGKEHGTWVQYYASGQIKEIRSFYYGEKTGELEGWWENGEKMLQYGFKEDEYEGTCREWNASGLLIQEMNYHEGRESGSQKVWYDDGKIKTNYIMIDGRRYGLLGTKNCINVSDSIF